VRPGKPKPNAAGDPRAKDAKLPDMRRLAITLLAWLCIAPAAAQTASTWPSKPVRLIVPYAPGGGIDFVARVLAQKLTEQPGGTFIVDNRPGAGGIVAAELVARAAPDGHTLLACATEFLTNAAVRSKLPFDPLKDFTPISQIGFVPFVIASHPSVPAKNVREVIALAKSRPGQLTYGSTTLGGGPHLAGELLQAMSGIRWVHVPFKGAAPASVALMSGEIDFMFASTAAIVGPVRSGKLRAVAVTGHKRIRELPDTPTVAESGLPGYSAIGIHGLLAPAGAAPDLVRRIHAETTRALGTPETIEKIAQGGGSEYVGTTPEEFSVFVRNEISKWTKLVKASNIRVE
jgi:tripartite-type tricarboxylate transporter receptor subunit TctC